LAGFLLFGKTVPTTFPSNKKRAVLYRKTMSKALANDYILSHAPEEKDIAEVFRRIRTEDEPFPSFTIWRKIADALEELWERGQVKRLPQDSRCSSTPNRDESLPFPSEKKG